LPYGLGLVGDELSDGRRDVAYPLRARLDAGGLVDGERGAGHHVGEARIADKVFERSACAESEGAWPSGRGLDAESFHHDSDRCGERDLKDRVERGEKEGLGVDERARLTQFERENAGLRMERDVVKRSVVLSVKEATR
jgi:hypothetical protein